MAKQDSKIRANEAAKIPSAVNETGKIPLLAIDMNDPFIDGTLRDYFKAGGNPERMSQRPFILSADDPVSLVVLRNYKLRSGGACDKIREKIALQAIRAFEAYQQTQVKKG